MTHDDAAADLRGDRLLALLLPVLAVPGVAARHLFSVPGDPLPRAITELTGLSAEQVFRFGGLQQAALRQVFRAEFESFYYFVLVGSLAYDSPLGDTIRHTAQESGAATREALQMAELLTAGVLPLLARGLPIGPDHESIETALRELFAQEQYGLRTLYEKVNPEEGLEPEDEEEFLSLTPRASDLNIFRLAVNLTQTAAHLLDHPLARALPTVPGLGPKARLTQLAARLKAMPAGKHTHLNRADTIRLYLCLQVVALLYVADLQPLIMDRLQETPTEPTPWTDHKLQQGATEWVCRHVEAFGMLFDDLYADEPEYQAAKEMARELAALV